MKNLKAYIEQKTAQGLLPTLRVRAGLSQNNVNSVADCIVHDLERGGVDNRTYLRLLRMIKEVELYCHRFELERPDFSYY